MFNVTCVAYWTNKVTATTTIIKTDEYSDWISRKILVTIIVFILCVF
jgi:hypothetical protein